MRNRLLMLPYNGITPSFATSPMHVGEGAAALGRVTVGRNAWLGALSVMRADGHDVRVGDDFHLGPRSTLHIAHDVFPCTVGDRVSVGENACVHACTVGSDVVVGDRVVLLDGSVTEDNVVFEADATVFPGKRIAGGYLYAGSPAKPVRPLETDEVAERRAAMRQARNETERIAQRETAFPASRIDQTVFIATTATVRGRIDMAANTSIFFSNDFDAGPGVIRVGRNTNIQDNTVIRCTGAGASFGENTTVGHNVLLHDCAVGNQSLIGIGSVVAPGTVVEDHVLLAAKARTAPGQVLESGWLYGGSPARQIAKLDEAKRDLIGFIIDMYCQYARDYKAAEEALHARRSLAG
jgi:gamma-carbonic anhydrase